MKHTAGEWKAIQGNSQMTWLETTVCCINYAQNPEGFHCVVSTAERHGDESATAKLIAAAPDLLEALIELKKWVGKLDDWKGIDPPTEIVDAAIKKALE